MMEQDQRERKLEYHREDVIKKCIDVLQLVSKQILRLCKNMQEPLCKMHCHNHKIIAK